jgi:hypothetical protein
LGFPVLMTCQMALDAASVETTPIRDLRLVVRRTVRSNGGSSLCRFAPHRGAFANALHYRPLVQVKPSKG